MLRTLPTILLQVGVVLALVAGTTAFVALDKRVTIAVDGHEQQVRSFARNVGDLLDSEHVPYDLAHDLVTPAPRRRSPTARPCRCATAVRCC